MNASQCRLGLLALVLVACTSTGENTDLSKEEARERGGKGDDGTDYCELFGWYGDDICDDFCINPDPDCAELCGGFANLPCPGDMSCVDDPRDTCDPNNGGADCGGICVEPEPIQCGGFAGLRCPVDLVCVDDPGDTCDPNNGGADCGGICRPRL